MGHMLYGKFKNEIALSQLVRRQEDGTDPDQTLFIETLNNLRRLNAPSNPGSC